MNSKLYAWAREVELKELGLTAKAVRKHAAMADDKIVNMLNRFASAEDFVEHMLDVFEAMDELE